MVKDQQPKVKDQQPKVYRAVAGVLFVETENEEHLSLIGRPGIYVRMRVTRYTRA